MCFFFVFFSLVADKAPLLGSVKSTHRLRLLLLRHGIYQESYYRIFGCHRLSYPKSVVRQAKGQFRLAKKMNP